MILTKMQAMLGVATGLLAAAATVGGGVMRLEKRFADMDTRMGKLESAIRTMNVTTPDERYKQLIKELMAQERENRSPLTGQPAQRFGGNSFPADAGASASTPAAPHGYARKDSTTHDYVCSHNGEAEVPCDVLFPPNGGASASSPAMVKPQ